MKTIIFSVVYNNYHDTVLFCESVASQKKFLISNIDCYLIDNSTNIEISNSLDNLIDTYSFLKIIRPPRNLGYFGAFNYALDFELHLDADYTLLCNNDLVFSDEFFHILYLKKYEKNIFAICPDVVTVDGHHQNPHVIKPLGIFQRIKLDLYFSHYYIACLLKGVRNLLNSCKITKKKKIDIAAYPSMNIHMGIGACYILPSVYFDFIKRLDYPFFLYGEEAFFSQQIHTAGGKLFYDPSLRVLHAESATLSKIPSRIAYEYARQGYATYRKFY